MVSMTDPFFNLFLVFILFALFHSITAQDYFKQWLARLSSSFFVDYFWRIIYCLISLYLWVECFFQPLTQLNDGHLLFNYPSFVWNLLPVAFFAGLIIAYWAFLQFDYLEFLGIKQAYFGIKRLLGPFNPRPFHPGRS